jgi:hypothetical protein
MAKKQAPKNTASLPLHIVGPIDIGYERHPSGTGKRVESRHVKDFWTDPRARRVEKKHGCYVFAIRAARGFMPWYVGKADRQLRKECFGTHQLNKYNRVLFTNGKGRPVMFFIVPQGSKNKVPKAIVAELETFLIQSAYMRNPSVTNTQNTRLPAWGIQGVVRSKRGRPTTPAGRFSTMMRIT